MSATRPIDRFTGPHAFLSNFYPSPLTLPGGDVAPTLEHAFQAYKCTLDDDYRRVLAASSPHEAKRLGRAARLRLDWDASRLHVMRWLLSLKFPLDGGDLTERLLATGDALLVEGNTWGDRFWGVDVSTGLPGEGKNWLGHLLLARRAELRAVIREDEHVSESTSR